jgi:magnesium-transporting ATPase (P-type)
MTGDVRLLVTRRMLSVPVILCAVGAIALVGGLFLAPERTWMNLLVDGFYVLSLGVSALFFFASQRLANSRWSVPIRRIPEAFALVLPAAAALMVVLAFGFHTLYDWMEPARLHEEHSLVAHPGRELYLAPWFVFARMIGVLVLWLVFAFRIRKISRAADADREAGLRAHVRLNRYAAIFTPLFAVTFTLAAYDWIISLDWKWFSTMFSVYVFAGSNVQGVAAIALAVVILKRKKLFGSAGSLITDDLVQTLGTMILAFSTFWGYIWVCQYLLIWYGNIPEEVTYYITRSNPSWLPVFLGGFVVSWIIPFFTLLPRNNKRSLRVMGAMSVLVLLGRWLDLYLMVMPSKWDAPRFGILEIAMAAGTGGLIYLIVVRGLSRAPLVPTHDPVIAIHTTHGHRDHVTHAPHAPQAPGGAP